MIVIGVALVVRTLVAGGGAVARSASCSACCSWPRAPVDSICSGATRVPLPQVNDRPISSRALFAVVYTTSVSSVYFALGVVARHADGLTPAVFLAAGIFFQLTAMTFGEGASLHQERGGSAVFARYAFNELVSFVAGWSIVAGLHDPDRRHRADGARLPGRLLGADRPRCARDRGRGGGDRVRARRQRDRASAPPGCAPGDGHDRRPGPAGRW